MEGRATRKQKKPRKEKAKPKLTVVFNGICIRGVRYKKAIPEARNKYQAQAAEARARDDVFRGRYGDEQSDVTLKEFVEKVYLSWSKDNKRSWKNDVSRSK